MTTLSLPSGLLKCYNPLTIALNPLFRLKKCQDRISGLLTTSHLRVPTCNLPCPRKNIIRLWAKECFLKRSGKFILFPARLGLLVRPASNPQKLNAVAEVIAVGPRREEDLRNASTISPMRQCVFLFNICK